MNENINLVEILKDCPSGIKLYSPILGIVEFQDTQGEKPHPIIVSPPGDGCYYFTKEGKFIDSKYGECMLFPSKDQRDWNKFKPMKPKFDPKTLQPFDRVLIRDYSRNKWACNFFSYIENETDEFKFSAIDCDYRFCIPYNEETKHLVGTTDEAPEYYRYWED